MIRRPAMHRQPSPARAAPVPACLRKAPSDAKSIEDSAFAAAGALTLLDAVVRRQERWAGAWRR